MEIKFNDISEIFDFLDKLGYSVKKNNECCKCSNIKEKTEEDNLEDNGFKLTREKWTPNPIYPPFTPSYPSYPITTYNNATQDPEFSKKLVM